MIIASYTIAMGYLQRLAMLIIIMLIICEGGPPYFFRQALKYAYRGGGV